MDPPPGEMCSRADVRLSLTCRYVLAFQGSLPRSNHHRGSRGCWVGRGWERPRSALGEAPGGSLSKQRTTKFC